MGMGRASGFATDVIDFGSVVVRSSGPDAQTEQAMLVAQTIMAIPFIVLIKFLGSIDLVRVVDRRGDI